MTDYTKHRFHVLDGMRGIAAILVVAYHLCGDMHLRVLKNTYLAVDFFFILSGFVIFHAYGEKLRKGLSLGEYLARRIGRLYPLLAIGVLLGLPALYANMPSAPSEYSKQDVIPTLASNLLMLPYVTGKRLVASQPFTNLELFPSDPSLWSISFEMFASMAFLFLFRLSERQLRNFCAGSFGALVIVSLLAGLTGGDYKLFEMGVGWATENILGGFPRLLYSFSAGMLIYLWRFTKPPPQLERLKFSLSPWLLYLMLIAMLIFPAYLEGLYGLFAVAFIAPLLVWLGSLSSCQNWFSEKTSEFLGWLSFPLYCIHYPVFATLRTFAWGANSSIDLSATQQLASVIAAVALSILIGIILDRLDVQRRFTGMLCRGFAALAR